VIIGAKTVAVFLALVSLAGGHLRGPSVPPQAISAAVIGDSYTAAFGTDPEHSWQQYAALDLGWRLDAVRGYPGAGYVNPGTGGPYEAGLAAAPLPATVDQVLVEGGFNDIAYGPEEVAAALTRTLALVRAQAPQAEITVIGTFDPGPGTFSDDYPNLHGNAPVVQRAVEAAGARYVDGFQFDYEVGLDGVHPSPTGHAELGHGIASAIRYLAPHAAGARPTTVTSRRAAVIGVSRVDAYGARWFFLASTEGGALGPARRVAFGEAGDVPTLLPNAAGECVPAVYRPSTGSCTPPRGSSTAAARCRRSRSATRATYRSRTPRTGHPATAPSFSTARRRAPSTRGPRGPTDSGTSPTWSSAGPGTGACCTRPPARARPSASTGPAPRPSTSPTRGRHRSPQRPRWRWGRPVTRGSSAPGVGTTSPAPTGSASSVRAPHSGSSPTRRPR
jgi:lysophospholipase L1-like esterase